MDGSDIKNAKNSLRRAIECARIAGLPNEKRIAYGFVFLLGKLKSRFKRLALDIPNLSNTANALFSVGEFYCKHSGRILIKGNEVDKILVRGQFSFFARLLRFLKNNRDYIVSERIECNVVLDFIALVWLSSVANRLYGYQISINDELIDFEKRLNE